MEYYVDGNNCVRCPCCDKKSWEGRKALEKVTPSTKKPGKPKGSGHYYRVLLTKTGTSDIDVQIRAMDKVLELVNNHLELRPFNRIFLYKLTQNNKMWEEEKQGIKESLTICKI